MKNCYRFLLFITLVLFISSVNIFAARRISLVDINTAEKESFRRIPGITKEISVKIVNYRKSKGLFKKIDDLKEMPEIDETLFESIKPYLIITHEREVKADKIYDRLNDLVENEAESLVDADIEMLDKYRNNPLDINSATKSQLVEIPFLSEDDVKNIIDYRRKKKGIKDINELAGILKSAKLEALSAFVEVKDTIEDDKITGDVRFRYGVWPYPFSSDYIEEDQVYHNPMYFYNRYRFYYGNQAEAGIVLRKDRFSRELNYENIRNYYIIKQYLTLRNKLGFDTLVLGNFELDFGQGVFIKPPAFLIRPIPRKSRGLREDKGSHFNQHFYGIAAAKTMGSLELYGYFSDKPYMVGYVNPDRSIGTPLIQMLEYFQSYLDHESKDNYDSFGALKENLYGARLEYDLTATWRLNAGYYESVFNPIIDPARLITSGNDKIHTYLISDYYFRGDKINLISVDTEYIYRNMRFYVDVGRCNSHIFKRTEALRDEFLTKPKNWQWIQADAYEFLAMLSYDKILYWISYQYIENDYFAYHSSPLKSVLETTDTFIRDFVGYLIGTKYSGKKYTTQLSLKYGTTIVSPKFYDPVSRTVGTWAAKDKFESYWDNEVALLRKFKLRYRNTYKLLRRTAARGEPTIIADMLAGTDFWAFIPYRSVKNRFEVIHTPIDTVMLKFRYETTDASYPDLSVNMYGYMTFGEVKYKPTSALSISSRVTYWDAPRGVAAGAMEYTWPNALIPFGYYSTYGATEKAFRWYIMPTIKFSRNAKLWIKYEFWPDVDGADKSVFKTQYEFSW